MNKKEKSEDKNIKWKNIWKDILYWIFFGILLLFFNYSKFNTETKLQSDFYLSMDEERKVAFIVLFIFALVLNIVLHVIKNKKLELYKKFIILATFIGICYGIVIPIGQGNDETAHFLRVFEVSQKYTTLNYKETTEFAEEFDTLFNYQSEADIEYQDYKDNYDAFFMDSDDKVDLKDKYWNTRLYSPIQYLPQVVGVIIGRIISDNILVIGTMGRLFGFIAWVTICAYAIRIIPNKKMFIMLLCLLPVNIFTAVCISGDTLTNAVSVLFLAIIYRKVYLKENVEIKDKIILLFLGALICLCKIVYVPIVFLILLLEKDNFKSKKQYIIFLVSVIIISCVVGFAWLMIGGNSLSDSNPASKDQIKFILEDPLRYALIVIETFMERGSNYMYQFTTGHKMVCQGRTEIYPIISHIIGIVLILSLFINEEDRELQIKKWRKVLVVLVILATFGLICTALYVQWTSLFEIGRGIIEGLQGRYFIPVSMIFIFLSNSIKVSMKNKESLITFLTVIQLPIIGLIMDSFIK